MLRGTRGVLLSAATATNSAPSGGAAGVSTNSLAIGGNIADTCTVLVYSSAGSGTMTVTVKMWGYANSIWCPMGSHATDASKGLLNEANAIGETSADTIAHAEPISYIGHFDRVYAELTVIGGSATAINVVIVSEKIID